MKKQLKSLLLIVLLVGIAFPVWGQAPSTEGRDFWVTFLRAADDDPTELKLTISAKEACNVTIENTQTGYSQTLSVTDNSSTELVMAKQDCYSSSNETPTYTALHVSSEKDISLFAGNYRDKSFDATNVLPTSALLDDYIIQTFPASDHEYFEVEQYGSKDGGARPQGSHFAIIAVENGQTTVDYNLTATTAGNKTGTQSITLNKGQVYYVWTGLTRGDESDLSGTTVKARNGKKIAVFQGCPHTNIPYAVRDRDHIVSQAMPLAYWGSEFAITASRKHRRDIVAIMAINDGTEVYINDEKGRRQLVHTFDFSTEKKHYWTFEIGEELAYCADIITKKDANGNKVKENGQDVNVPGSPYTGQLPAPLVIDSSCYITTSCPAGVHLFMVSNRYDNYTEKVKSDTLVSDPAMLWISPIEQVIKEINFATYHTKQAKFHFMNIVTLTSNVETMTWNGNSIKKYFHRIRGNNEYSFARIEINEGNHNLKGDLGFLAHVYGYGERESYAYSCGSSTIQRSISFNDEPLTIDDVASKTFCVEEEIEMKLNIGNNDYESVIWDFGDGTTFSPDPEASNKEKRLASHLYTTPGWYDLEVTAVYTNSCTGAKHKDNMHISFYIARADTVYINPGHECLSLEKQAAMTAEQIAELLSSMHNDTLWELREHCYDTVFIQPTVYGLDTYHEFEEQVARDSVKIGNKWYYAFPDVQDIPDTIPNSWGCDSILLYHMRITTALDFALNEQTAETCEKEDVAMSYTYRKGEIGKAWIIDKANPNKKYEVENYPTALGTDDIILPTSQLKAGKYNMELKLVDAVFGDTVVCPFTLYVLYPANIFKIKFGNVLAVYNSKYNGGYNFTGFQWFMNGDTIPGATQSVYHSETQFTIGDIFYVELTDANGMKLQSCPQTVTSAPSVNEKKDMPAEKILQDRHLYIRKDDTLYDIYGQRVR